MLMQLPRSTRTRRKNKVCSRLSKKRGRKSNYVKSLVGQYWETVKRKIRLRDNFSCQICQHKINLETHHITYYLNGSTIRGKELDNLEWLILLCGDCHGEVHKRKEHPLNPKNRKKLNSKQFKEHQSKICHSLIK